MIIKICIGVLVGIGLFMILADCFRIPYMRTSKAVNNLAKQQKEKTSSLDVWLSSFASFIARKLKLNEFERAQLESDLRTAQMDICLTAGIPIQAEQEQTMPISKALKTFHQQTVQQ